MFTFWDNMTLAVFVETTFEIVFKNEHFFRYIPPRLTEYILNKKQF